MNFIQKVSNAKSKNKGVLTKNNSESSSESFESTESENKCGTQRNKIVESDSELSDSSFEDASEF